jgi:ABC-2 type transport system ATP-binding protein
MKENIAIQIDSVTKAFKNTIAVNNLNLQIYRGEFVALLGPNGAGKTTLVEMIEGVQIPDSGKIQILGKTWKDNEKEIKSKIGFSFQETKFTDKLTVFETIKLFSSFYNQTDKIDYAIEATNLKSKKDTYVVNLSGGQRQRLALSIALLNEPEILILDEPTTGLDPTARREIWDVLTILKKKKVTLILTTHYMEEAEYLCERILIMDKGKFIAEGSLSELLKKYKLNEIIEFKLKSNVKFQLNRFKGVEDFSFDEKTRTGKILVKDIVNTLPEFLKQIHNSKLKLDTLECRKMTLDDLFLNLTGRRLDA